MADKRPFEIEQTSSGFRIRNINPVKQEAWEYYMCEAVKSVVGVNQPGFGTRNTNTNQRRNPIREDDHRMIIITFEDGTAPVEYNIVYVQNQPLWTNDFAGLEEALSDIASWCESAGSSIPSIIAGNTETPTTIQDTSSGAVGSTNSGVKGFSIAFEGVGGALNGVPVPDGYISNKSASLGNTLASESYTVPNTAGASPLGPRVVISYVT